MAWGGAVCGGWALLMFLLENYDTSTTTMCFAVLFSYIARPREIRHVHFEAHACAQTYGVKTMGRLKKSPAVQVFCHRVHSKCRRLQKNLEVEFEAGWSSFSPQ